MKNFKYFFNIYSILQQNYSDFRVIVIDDASSDHTADNIEVELDKIDHKKRVKLIRNKKRIGHMVNIYLSVHQYCKKG